MTQTKKAGQALKKSEETKTRILQSALELFQEKGFEQTTMRDIAERASVALGGAYYYFDSKDKMVLAYYEQSLKETLAYIELPEFQNSRDLKERLKLLMDFKLRRLKPYRKFLGVLSNPDSPVSPFSDATAPLREENISLFEEVVNGSDLSIPADMKPHLPRLLWFYQMGMILFWLHDRSRNQTRTKELLDKSLELLLNLIKIGKLPLMGSVRKSVLELITI